MGAIQRKEKAMASPEETLRELGFVLRSVAIGDRPLVPWVRSGNLLFLSGAGPSPNQAGRAWAGQVGREYTTAEGYEAARDCGLNLLAAAMAAVGELAHVRRVVKVLGMVNCPAGFSEQPQVINGCSELLVRVFGDAGRHARSAVGMAGLPGNIPVEIEMILEVD
jgi:enamine deaminase RidA (YjgF/YER057c/UK114 family)